MLFFTITCNPLFSSLVRMVLLGQEGQERPKYLNVKWQQGWELRGERVEYFNIVHFTGGHLCVCICEFVFVFVFAYLYLCICICVFVFVYLNMCICICVFLFFFSIWHCLVSATLPSHPLRLNRSPSQRHQALL